MKKHLILILCIFACVASFAQVDRSKRPKPAAAPEIQLGNIESYELPNGLKIFVVENRKIPKVSVSMRFDIDPITEGKYAGSVELAGQLLSTGTVNRTKDQIDEEVDFIGASLNASANSVYASSLSQHKDKLFDLLSDVVVNAKFNEAEFQKLKTQAMSGLAMAKENPDQIADKVGNAILFGKDHPYGEFQTEQTIENVTLDQCKMYYDKYIKPNNTYMAIVGDINLPHAKDLVEKYFASWKQGDVPVHSYKPPQGPDETGVALVDRPNAVQSIIKVTHPIYLPPGHPDVYAARLASTLLGGGASFRLFQNLREEHAYTYGAYSRIDVDELAGYFYAGASVRNAVTDSAVTELLYEIRRMNEEKVTAKELQLAKNFLTGSFARGLEDPQTVARFAINIDRYQLDADYYKNYLKKLNAVTVDDIVNAAEKYMNFDKAHVVVVGKGDEIAAKLKQFGKVTYYDTDANSYDPNAMALPEGLTGEQVIADYSKAMLNGANPDKIVDMKVEMGASMMGMELSITTTRKAPNMMLVEVTSPMFFQKVVFDGKSGSNSNSMTGTKPMTEDELAEMKYEAQMFPEKYYKEWGFKMELKGIDRVKGSDAYRVEVTSPTGSSSTQYYDVKSKLKVKESKTDEVEGMGAVTQITNFEDYKEVKGIGILFPNKISQQTGPQKVEMTLKKIEYNTKVKKSVFKMK